MAERRSLRGFLAARRLSWRHFWSRRAQWRITLVKLFTLAALLIVVYLVIPHDANTWMNQMWQVAVQFIASLDRIALLAGTAGLLVLLCLLLIFVQPYRRATYLAATPSAIPPITVYIDAENQLSASTIRPFKRFLMEHLNGRRADLLYFMDASQTSMTGKYKALYRFGFRPVDVPHDPTGNGEVKEAVDKEIAMHAIERALRGPKKQEFIIVTGDGDFVGLVYHLVALGHQVQVWATPILEAYRTLATYLDVNVLDLGSVISERQTQTEPPRAMALALPVSRSPKPIRRPSVDQGKRSGGPVMASHAAHPDVFAFPGEEWLYQAIAETLRARSRSQKQSRSDERKDSSFRAFLGGNLGPRLAGVGYGAGNRLDFWIEHLVTLQVLALRPGKVFPTVGPTSAEAAARALFAMADTAARAAVAVTPAREDGLVQMGEVATVLAGMLQDSSPVGPLRQLVVGGGVRRATHARYFVRCARALGLIEFDDVPDSLDVIHSPRIIAFLEPNQPDEMPQHAEATEAPNPADDAANGATTEPENTPPGDVENASGMTTGNDAEGVPASVPVTTETVETVADETPGMGPETTP